MKRRLRVSLVMVAFSGIVWGLWNPPRKARSETSSPVVILFTNDLGGFLESCKCSGPSAVGLPRLVGTLKRLQQEYPESVVIDSGNLGPDLPTAEVAAQALATVPYDAVGVGGADLKLGPAFWRVARQTNLPLLVSNRPFAESTPPSVSPVRVVQRQGLKIALLGFSPPSPVKERLGLDQPEDPVRSSAETPPERSPRDCLAMVPTDVDVVIVMSQLGLKEDLQLAKELAPQHPHQRILLFGGAAWESLLAPMSVGSTVIIPTGGHAQSVAIVELASSSGPVEVKYRKHSITGHDPLDPEVAEMVHRHYMKLAEETQNQEATRRHLSYMCPPANVPLATRRLSGSGRSLPMLTPWRR